MRLAAGNFMQQPQALRGMGRVYFNPAEGPAAAARFDNVDREVARMTHALANEKGISDEAALNEIETMLRQVLEAYGDIDELEDAA